LISTKIFFNMDTQFSAAVAAPAVPEPTSFIDVLTTMAIQEAK